MFKTATDTLGPSGMTVFQTRHSGAIDTEPCQARSPTQINDKCPDYSNNSDPSSSQALVENESLPEISDAVPDTSGGTRSEECNDVQESRKAGTRSGKEEPVPKSARVISGRGHHRLRMLIDHLMCRDGKLGTLVLK